jgi:hypothetical protein
MKKSILLIAAVLIRLGVSAQIDSTKGIILPPDLQNTNDGLNRKDFNGKEMPQNQENNNLQNPGNVGLMRSDSLLMQNGIKNHPDGVMMKNGSMWRIMDNRMVVLDRTLTMSNGTQVMSDGTYLRTDGTRIKFKEGEHMDLTGKMMPMFK